MAAFAPSASSVILQAGFARAAGLRKNRVGFAIHLLQAENRVSCRLRRRRRAAPPVAPNESSGAPVLRRCRCGRPGSRLPAPGVADRSARLSADLLQAFGKAGVECRGGPRADLLHLRRQYATRSLWARISAAISAPSRERNAFRLVERFGQRLEQGRFRSLRRLGVRRLRRTFPAGETRRSDRAADPMPCSAAASRNAFRYCSSSARFTPSGRRSRRSLRQRDAHFHVSARHPRS